MGKQSPISESQKIELVMALLRREAPGAELARRYGVSEAAMYRWRDLFLDAGKQGLKSKVAASDNDEIRRLKRDLEEHKQVIGEYAFANDWLKKRLERTS